MADSATSGNQYAYGPVPSRRLGKSLGVNNIPVKVCSYSCIYCQASRTTQLQSERGFFYDPEDIFRHVSNRLEKARAAAERVDYVAFVPNGEPTLDVNLGTEIRLLKTLEIPVAVITNSSLLWRDDVRAELALADWVSLKIDAVQEATWQRINRPQRAARLSLILDGMIAFAQAFAGKLVTETMLVGRLNDGRQCLRAIAEFIHRLQPSRAYLSVPTRPPAERWVHRPAEDALNLAYQIFAHKVTPVAFLNLYEGDAFAFTGDIEKDLLSITAVHPMRKEAVCNFLARAGSTWEIIDRMVDQGDLVETEYDGHRFYVRKSSSVPEAPGA